MAGSGGFGGHPQCNRRHGRQRGAHCLLALFRPVGEALGADELDIIDADKAEDRAQIRLVEVVGLLRRSGRLKTAAR
jgi:hypothetical protein